MPKIDFQTKIFLWFEQLDIVQRPDQFRPAITPEAKEISPYDVYLFEDREDLINFFAKYLHRVDDFVIKYFLEDTIFWVSKKTGCLIVSKRLCDCAIAYLHKSELQAIYDKEQADDIHSRGKLTPQEKAVEWESYDICAPGLSATDARCNFFGNDCQKCLLEYASHEPEYDTIKNECVNLAKI